jgi:rubrerythrin
MNLFQKWLKNPTVPVKEKPKVQFTKSEREKIRKETFKASLTKQQNPWAICTAAVGRDDKEKYESCVLSIKEQYGISKDEADPQEGSGEFEPSITESTEKAVPDEEAMSYINSGRLNDLRIKLSDEGWSDSEIKQLIDHYQNTKKDSSNSYKVKRGNDGFFYIVDENNKSVSGKYFTTEEKAKQYIDSISKDVGVDYAGPVPNSGLAEQDLEGNKESSSDEKATKNDSHQYRSIDIEIQDGKAVFSINGKKYIARDFSAAMDMIDNLLSKSFITKNSYNVNVIYQTDDWSKKRKSYNIEAANVVEAKTKTEEIFYREYPSRGGYFLEKIESVTEVSKSINKNREELAEEIQNGDRILCNDNKVRTVQYVSEPNGLIVVVYTDGRKETYRSADTVEQVGKSIKKVAVSSELINEAKNLLSHGNMMMAVVGILDKKYGDKESALKATAIAAKELGKSIPSEVDDWIESEHDAHEKYHNAAGEAESSSQRETFNDMAEDEMTHAQELEDMKEDEMIESSISEAFGTNKSLKKTNQSYRIKVTSKNGYVKVVEAKGFSSAEEAISAIKRSPVVESAELEKDIRPYGQAYQAVSLHKDPDNISEYEIDPNYSMTGETGDTTKSVVKKTRTKAEVKRDIEATTKRWYQTPVFDSMTRNEVKNELDRLQDELSEIVLRELNTQKSRNEQIIDTINSVPKLSFVDAWKGFNKSTPNEQIDKFACQVNSVFGTCVVTDTSNKEKIVDWISGKGFSTTDANKIYRSAIIKAYLEKQPREVIFRE